MERIIAKPMVNSFCLHFIPNSVENNLYFNDASNRKKVYL